MVADGRRDAEYRLQEERRDADEQQEVVQLGDGLGVDVEARDLAVGERHDGRQQHQQRQLRHGVHGQTHVYVPPGTVAETTRSGQTGLGTLEF